jgi:hypothetical protein
LVKNNSVSVNEVGPQEKKIAFSKKKFLKVPPPKKKKKNIKDFSFNIKTSYNILNRDRIKIKEKRILIR